MRVTLLPELFDPPVQHTLLVALLCYPLDDRHRVDVDITHPTVSAWLAAQASGLREEVELALELSAQAEVLEPSHTAVEIIRAAPSNYVANPVRVNVDDARRFLDGPFEILLEDARSDRAFLERMLTSQERAFLAHRIQAGFVRVEHGGGIPSMTRRIQRADELAISFREYNIPVIPIVSDDFGVATRALARPRSQGDRTGEADMIHALTRTPRFNLHDRLESLRSELLQPLGWGDLDFEAVLEVVKAGADLDLQGDSVEQVSALLRTDDTELERAFEYLVRVAELLRDRCDILSWKLVPYASQAVLLADALRAAGQRDVRDDLADWFWMTTYGEMFAGLSDYRLGRAFRDLRQTVSDGQLRWSGPSPFRIRELPGTTEFHVVRVKTVALTLARQIKAIGVNAAGTAEHDPCATLAAYGRGAMFSLVPLALVRSTSVFSDLGNWFLCRPTEAIALRNRLLSAQLGERERAAHAVSEAAFEAAQRGEWNDFIARRRLEIDALERSFVSDVLARHPALLPPQIG